MLKESNETRDVGLMAAAPAVSAAQARLMSGRIGPGWQRILTAALLLCAAHTSVAAEILAGGGSTLSSRDDASVSLNITYLTKRRFVIEAAYLDDRIIDRNRFKLGPEGRRVDPYYYLAFRYRWQRQSGRFLPFFGTGIMATSAENTLFSSRLLFSHAAGVRVANLEVSYGIFPTRALVRRTKVMICCCCNTGFKNRALLSPKKSHGKVTNIVTPRLRSS